MRTKNSSFSGWLKRIALLALIAVMMVSAVACGSDNSSDSDDSVYIPPVYVSPYVRMVKDATNSNYGITYGDAFDSFFSDPEWSYFEASTGENVVEFEGRFLYDAFVLNNKANACYYHGAALG